MSEARISRRLWGAAHGREVFLYTLASGRGLTVHISNYGGVIQSIWVPGRDGRAGNVALGFATLDEYRSDFERQPWPASGGSGNAYFGAAVGRYANRIGGHRVALDGRSYELAANQGENTLHGGPEGWSCAVWSVLDVRRARNAVSLTLGHVDPDGHNGFPGEVTVTLTYTLTAAGALAAEWKATTNAATVINVTQHTYFNLAGEGSGSIEAQLLKLPAQRFLPIGPDLLPTGEFVDVPGTPFDFRRLRPIGRHLLAAGRPWGEQLALAHGYDHNWVLDGPDGGLRPAAVAVDPESGRRLRVFTTEPGVQFYTGNFLLGDLAGSSGRLYRQGAGFALETQHYPDSPHHQGEPGWPSVVLAAGETFTSRTVYEFSAAGRG